MEQSAVRSFPCMHCTAGQLILGYIVQGGQYILGYDVRGTMCPRISCLVGTEKRGDNINCDTSLIDSWLMLSEIA